MEYNKSIPIVGLTPQGKAVYIKNVVEKYAEMPENALFSLISALKNDIISVDEVLDIIDMKNKIQLIKEQHPYPIHYTEKSGWFTVVDDISQLNGKRKIRKCSEEKLWDALVTWYIDKESKNINFKELYAQWIDWKRTPNNEDNISRLEYEWKAYYLNEPLSRELLNKPVNKITSLELREWAETLLKKHYPVDKKKFSRMFTIVNQCFEYAADEDIAIVSENVWQKARKKINKKLIVNKPVASDESQIFTDEERRTMKQMIYADMGKYKKQNSAAGLQILFILETGIRIGEACGLKWSDIIDDRLYIRRQANNKSVKEWTKSHDGYRDIPLTTEAKRVLEDVRKYNAEHGYNAEWIFQSSNPNYDHRLSYNAADRKLRKLCERMHTEMKSPHKCRKTVLSCLLDSPDISNRTVQRFAGHADISTTMQFYNFERRSKQEQAQAIDKALAV